MKAQRTIHATKGQERVVEWTDKTLGHCKRMSCRQAMDTHGNVARTRLMHHQPVPNQYNGGGP